MVFRLGPWIIDPSARQVGQGADAIRFSPKAMAVLDVLVAARGAVVSRSELLEKVWPHVTVGEEVLT
ncbi:MAG: winged helix-turn-helix domain-containing protein [Pseudomonadota bacterium]